MAALVGTFVAVTAFAPAPGAPALAPAGAARLPAARRMRMQFGFPNPFGNDDEAGKSKTEDEGNGGWGLPNPFAGGGEGEREAAKDGEEGGWLNPWSRDYGQEGEDGAPPPGFFSNPFGNDDEGGAPTVQRTDNPWKLPILDDSLPDPIYDAPSTYKGRVPYGFSTNAELLNGRAAMIGFAILFLQELLFGKGVFELYGIPLAEGAKGSVM